MIKARKKARQRLKLATRAEYEALIFAAKLTPTQEQIINLRILHDLPICEIAARLNCCESIIRRRLAEIHDRISTL